MKVEGNGSSPHPGDTLNPGYPYNYCTIPDDGYIVIDVFQYPGTTYLTTTTIKQSNSSAPVSYYENGLPDGVLTFTYTGTTQVDGQTRDTYTISSSVLVTPPPIVTNAGWLNGLGNTNSTLVVNKSYWTQDYGMNEQGPTFYRWIVRDNAIYQSTQNYNNNCGSRVYPAMVSALSPSYQVSTNPPARGIAFEGVWQCCIKIGSNGLKTNPFCETFYLAERKNLSWGPANYLDGSSDGGQGGYGREIDIMETKWNQNNTKWGPQVNLPNGNNTGWSTNNITTKDSGFVYGTWNEVGGIAPGTPPPILSPLEY